MSIVLTTALATAQAVSSCSWNEPGHNPYMGTMAAAVERYADIPAPVRQRLRERMAVHAYDDLVAIRRDSITGRHRYAPELKQMHFGAGQVCGRVDRARWSDSAVERGLVYCEDGHCLVVPTVCRNVSRLQRLPDAPVAGGGGGRDGAPPPLLVAGPATGSTAPGDGGAPGDPLAGDGELTLAPTGGGPSFVEVMQFDPATPLVFLGVGAAVVATAAPGEGGWLSGGGGGGSGSAGFGPGRNETGVEPLLPGTGAGTAPGTAPGGEPDGPAMPADPRLPADPLNPSPEFPPSDPVPPLAVDPDMAPRDWGPFRPDGFTPELVPEFDPGQGPLAPIPEPGRGLLLLAGVLALAGLRRWHR